MRARLFAFLASIALIACGSSSRSAAVPLDPQQSPTGVRWVDNAALLLPHAYEGQPYQAVQIAGLTKGGDYPYTFVVVGGALPPGLVLSRDGRVSGTPALAGAYQVSVRVTDASKTFDTLSDYFVVR